MIMKFDNWWFQESGFGGPPESVHSYQGKVARSAWNAALKNGNKWIPVDFTKPRDEWPEFLEADMAYEVCIGGVVDVDNWISEKGNFLHNHRDFVTHIKPITLSKPPGGE